MSAKKLRFDALTTWRFVAGFHLVVFHEAIRQGWQLDQPWRNMVDAAYMQVTYFFLVSGFVFGMHYGPAVERGSLNLRNFLLGRLTRLYPVYILALILAAPFFVRDLVHNLGGISHAIAPFLAQALAKIALLQAWFPKTATEWNPPSWAMSAVAFFYLAFPFFASRIGKRDNPSVARFAVGAFLASLIPALVYCATAPDGWRGNAFEHQTPLVVFMRLNPAIRLPEFVMGLCLAKLYRSGAFANLSAGASRALTWVGVLGILGFAAFSTQIPYLLLHHTLPIIPYVALLIGLAREEERGEAKLLRAKPLVTLGNASFSMYILHVPLFLVTAFLAQKFVGSDKGPAIAVANLVLAIAVAQFGVRYLEGPSRQWMNRLLRVGEAR